MSFDVHTKENIAIALSSMIFFYIARVVVESFELIGKKVSIKYQKEWFNLSVSVTHSCVTSALCLGAFAADPHLWQNMGTTTSTFIVRLATYVPVGYFIYDMFDLAKNFNFWDVLTVLIHHITVITNCCVFGNELKYYNFLIMAYSCEINSVFLHVRRLFRLSCFPQNHFIYKLNKHANFLTFVVFRLLALFWMLICAVYYDRKELSKIPIVWAFGIASIVIMGIINLVLFSRVVRTDYLKTSKSQKKLE